MKGTDADLLELTLREGLDAGVPDKTLEVGVMRMAEIAEQEEEEAKRKKAAAAAAAAAAAESRASHRPALSQRTGPLSRRASSSSSSSLLSNGTHRGGGGNHNAELRDGTLVKLCGLKSGMQLGGLQRLSLEKYNGRMGRVVDYAPAWLIRVLVPGSAAVGAAQVPESKFVSVLLDSRSTDHDRANGIWLSVLREENVKVQ